VESDPEKLADWIMAYEPEKMEKKWIYVGWESCCSSY
jgi:hypothetical protein